jgi:hypothetical protein
MPNQHAKRQLNVRLDGEAHDLLAELSKQHGSKAAALEYAISLAAGRNQPSDDALVDMLRERLKGRP